MPLFEKKIDIEAALAKALGWVKNNSVPGEGVMVSSRQRVSYPEVTGYFIPTLLNAGEDNLAFEYAKFLCSIQKPNGSFAGPDGREYIFDSGQVLRGLISASERWPEFKAYAQKTADYLLSSMQDNGCLPAIYDYPIPAAIQVFVLPALHQASQLFNDSRFSKAAQKGVYFYKNAEDVLFKGHITHFLAYILDGFIDMGERDFVLQTVRDVFAKQKKDGSIPAYPNTHWVCSTGVAQLGIIAYKLGMKPEMEAAWSYLLKVQNSSGGFWGSYGLFGKYFPQEEISWANKFFLDLLYHKCHPRKGEDPEQR